MLLKEFISGSVRGLEPIYGPQEARSIVMRLCEACLDTKSYTHIINPDFEIGADKMPVLDAAMARLMAGEPLQYVLGFAEFCGFRFKVGPSVLIPRQETELLCTMASESISRRKRMRSAFGKSEVKVLDLCTGSGCIAWTLALSVPGTRVFGVDVSEEALDVASGQDFRSELKRQDAIRPSFLKCDILDLGEGGCLPEEISGQGGFDVLVSNPPYVRESEKARMKDNVLGHEPGLALFVPDEDPLKFYRAIAFWAGQTLVPGGAGFVEINEALGHETERIFEAAGFSGVGVINDLCGKNRFVKFIR